MNNAGDVIIQGRVVVNKQSSRLETAQWVRDVNVSAAEIVMERQLF